jgi:hypothetical protein
MRRIDELHLKFPFAGARMLRDMLNGEGIEIGHKHVGTLMDKMEHCGDLPQAQHQRTASGSIRRASLAQRQVRARLSACV